MVVTIGPVQLLVLGFQNPDFHGEVIAELERLRESETVKVIDALAVYKDAEGGIEVFSDEEAWDVLEAIPNDSAAALLLLEHHWAVPLRDAIARAGGFRIDEGFISPLDLVGIGLLTAEEAHEMHTREQEMRVAGGGGPDVPQQRQQTAMPESTRTEA